MIVMRKLFDIRFLLVVVPAFLLHGCEDESHHDGLNDAQNFVVFTFFMWILVIILVVVMHFWVPGSNWPSIKQVFRAPTHDISDHDDDKQIEEEYTCDWNTLGKSPSGKYYFSKVLQTSISCQEISNERKMLYDLKSNL